MQGRLNRLSLIIKSLRSAPDIKRERRSKKEQGKLVTTNYQLTFFSRKTKDAQTVEGEGTLRVENSNESGENKKADMKRNERQQVWMDSWRGRMSSVGD